MPRSKPRGGAAVELAALMVMLVPLVMYTLYLEDLLTYKLDQAETVTSAPWDLVHHDYRHRENGPIADGTTHATRTTYADHTSAWNTYSNPDVDKEDTRHHQALTAHQCWLTEGGEQVTCGFFSEGNGRETEPLFSGIAYKGHLAGCFAILGVQNYFLPEHFLGHAVAYSQRFTGGNIHDNAKTDHWLFPQETFSVLHDPFALNWIKATGSFGSRGNASMSLLDPINHPQNMQSEWYDWVERPYRVALVEQPRYTRVNDFVNALVSDFLARPASQDGIGDEVSTAPQAYQENPTGRFNSFYPSGYADRREQNTYSHRENAYLGARDDQW